MKITISKETLHQTLVFLPVCMSEFSMGLGYGWVAPTLKKLQDPSSEIPITIEQCSWIGSLHELGKVFGPVFTSILLDRIGRKSVLALCTLIYFTVWLSIVLTKSVPVIYGLRFLFGIAVGAGDVTSAIYLAENSTPKLRGIFSSITILFFFIGILVEFFIAMYFSYNTTAAINLAVSILTVASVFLLRETPQYLMMQKNFEDAGITLMWLKGTTMWNDVYAEFENMKQNIEMERARKSFKEIFSSAANYKSLLITVVLNVLNTSTGYAAIVAFATMIFLSSGFFSTYGFTIVFGAIQIIGAILSMFFIERFNRRTILIVSFSLFVILHLCTSVFYYVQEKVGLQSTNALSWLIFCTVSVYGSIYCFTFPVIHIIRGELFPHSIKSVATSITVMLHAASTFISSKLFLTIAMNYGFHVNFAIFAFVSVLVLIFTYLKLPETKGKLLADIHRLFEK